jgi:hypothetical protein
MMEERIPCIRSSIITVSKEETDARDDGAVGWDGAVHSARGAGNRMEIAGTEREDGLL